MARRRSPPRLIVVPYYVRPSEAGIVEHFKAVAAASPVPLVIYNIPARTGRNLGPAGMLELAGTPEHRRVEAGAARARRRDARDPGPRPAGVLGAGRRRPRAVPDHAHGRRGHHQRRRAPVHQPLRGDDRVRARGQGRRRPHPRRGAAAGRAGRLRRAESVGLQGRAPRPGPHPHARRAPAAGERRDGRRSTGRSPRSTPPPDAAVATSWRRGRLPGREPDATRSEPVASRNPSCYKYGTAPFRISPPSSNSPEPLHDQCADPPGPGPFLRTALVDPGRALLQPPRDRARQHDPQRRHPDHRARPRRHEQPAAVDGRRVHAGVRRAAAHRRAAWATGSGVAARCRSASWCSASARSRRRSRTAPTS